MTINTDHYQVLGVVPSAEDMVIKAAYRALVNIYHPDKNSSIEAEDKIKQINIAYDILSDPVKRKEYDASRRQLEHDASPTEFEQGNPFASEPLESSWALAVSFYPSIEREFKDLEKISWRLGFAFKLHLLEEQNFSNSYKISLKLKYEYLSRYFGKDKEVIKYAERLIKAREIQAALYLNKIINVMGRSVSIWDITRKVNNKFPDISRTLEKRHLYHLIRDSYGNYSVNPAIKLVMLNGGSVKKSFFSSNIVAFINGKKYTFDSGPDFCRYVLKLYIEDYA